MKIGILTVPFNNNCGGYLQAYALKTILQNLGHDVIFLNRQWNRHIPFITRLKNVIKIMLGRKVSTEITGDQNPFVKQYLNPITRRFFSSHQLRKFVSSNSFDCIIVGSDQVWRYAYAKSTITDFFFKFLNTSNTLRISYAASFGIDELDYPENIKKECEILLKSFDAISVRERSGIRLLKELGVSQHVHFILDPTMLLNKNFYFKHLIQNKIQARSSKFLFNYILDYSDEKDEFIKNIASILNLDMCKYNLNGVVNVESWLSDIYHSSFVVTDSFHGAVFSIIFNKPFIVITNKERGLARFESLLEQFDLKKRCVDSDSLESFDFILTEIDWNSVNQKLHNRRCESIKYLSSSLDKI